MNVVNIYYDEVRRTLYWSPHKIKQRLNDQRFIILVNREEKTIQKTISVEKLKPAFLAKTDFQIEDNQKLDKNNSHPLRTQNIFNKKSYICPKYELHAVKRKYFKSSNPKKLWFENLYTYSKR